MAGGQPISVENLREVRRVASRYGVRVILDATRVAENAYFNQQREPGQAGRPVAAIVRDICSLSDGCTMSAKKDPLANIGGFLALNDDDVAERARNMVVIYEGLHTYGGMAGRDMEAVAIGIEESIQDDHMRARVGQVHYLGQRLQGFGVPIVLPVGGHGVFLDARAFLPDVPQEHYPAQSLAAAIYLDSGVRTMERGMVSAGRDRVTGSERRPKLELVRLALPRRVYTQAHMDAVAESVAAVYEERGNVRGLRMTYEPEYLRFFQARFEPVAPRDVTAAEAAGA
jgi:tyrosine phenol-lyase